MTRSRRSLLRPLLLGGLLLAYGGYQALSAFSDRWLVTINETESLPHWAYLIDRRAEPSRGDLIYFVPPDNPYYEDTGFVKIIAGAPGDRVTREARVFSINGDPLCAAKARSQGGDPLALGPTGVIPHGHYFVFTPHRDSYDSRYQDIGWISRDLIIGVARPIL